MPESAQRAAALLLAARRDPAQRLADLPEPLRPASQEAAYAIQQAVAAELAPIGGWKVGAAGPEAPPMCGFMPASGISASPARIKATGATLYAEAEVCFRLARDLPPREGPYTAAEVTGAIAAAHPAIEYLAPRYLDPDAVASLTHLADSQGHGGFVHGPACEAWQAIGFGTEVVEQVVDGGPVLTRIGNPAGDMIRLVVWLANQGSVWAGGLKAGQFVTCGSWTGKTRMAHGARVRFPSLGEVVLEVA